MEDELRVVLVDDNDNARLLVRRLLELAGAAKVVAEAPNGAAAIQVCRREHPDIVVMDSQMPEMDGFTATRFLKLEDPTISIIMVSSFGGTQTRRLAEEAGADKFLDKESLVGEICRMVEVLRKERTGARHLPELPGEAPVVH